MDPSLGVSRIQLIVGGCQLTRHQAHQMSKIKRNIRKLRCLADRSSGLAFHSGRYQLQHSRPFSSYKPNVFAVWHDWIILRCIGVAASESSSVLILYDYLDMIYDIHMYIHIPNMHIKSHQATNHLTSHVQQTQSYLQQCLWIDFCMSRSCCRYCLANGSDP